VGCLVGLYPSVRRTYQYSYYVLGETSSPEAAMPIGSTVAIGSPVRVTVGGCVGGLAVRYGTHCSQTCGG